jgi:hypothetical protein
LLTIKIYHKFGTLAIIYLIFSCKSVDFLTASGRNPSAQESRTSRTPLFRFVFNRTSEGADVWMADRPPQGEQANGNGWYNSPLPMTKSTKMR